MPFPEGRRVCADNDQCRYPIVSARDGKAGAHLRESVETLHYGVTETPRNHTEAPAAMMFAGATPFIELIDDRNQVWTIVSPFRCALLPMSMALRVLRASVVDLGLA